MDGRNAGNAGAIAGGVERRLELGVRRLAIVEAKVEKRFEWIACRAWKVERHARTLESCRCVHGKNKAACGALSVVGGEWGAVHENPSSVCQELRVAHAVASAVGAELDLHAPS